MSRWGEGRKSKGDDTLSEQVMARLTKRQHAAYLAAGGAQWLRRQIDAEIARRVRYPEPTAHNPFPSSLIVTPLSKQPVPISVTVLEY